MSEVIQSEVNQDIPAAQDENRGAQWEIQSLPSAVGAVESGNTLVDNYEPSHVLRDEYCEDGLIPLIGDKWSTIPLDSEMTLDQSLPGSSKSAIIQAKSAAVSMIQSSTEQLLPFRQVKSDSNMAKLTKLSDTILQELANGFKIMLMASDHFTNENSERISRIDKLKIILFHAMKNLYPKREELKEVDRLFGNKFFGVENKLNGIGAYLMNASINARTGLKIYNELLRENLDKFLSSNTSELKEIEMKAKEHSEYKFQIPTPMDQASEEPEFTLEFIPETGQLIVKNVYEYDGDLSYSKLKFQEKLWILDAIFEQIKNLAEQSLSDLKELPIYFKEFKSTGKILARKIHNVRVFYDHSMESHILQMRDQMEHKFPTGAVTDSTLADLLKSVSAVTANLIRFNETVGSYFRRQLNEIEEMKDARKKIITGKSSNLKYKWMGRKENVEVQLPSLSRTSFLVRSNAYGDSLTLRIGESDMNTLPDDHDHGHGQAHNRGGGWFSKMFTRVWDALTWQE